MKKVKRAIAMFLAIFAFVIFCFGPMAQSANALVGIDDALIAVVIAALAAVGITFITTGAYTSIRGYVSDLMTDYAISSDTTVAAQFRQSQLGVNNLGKLLTNNRFVVYIQGFAAYLIARFGLQDNEVIHLVTPGLSINGVTAYRLPLSFSGYYDYEYEFTVITSDVPVYAFSVDHGEAYPTLYLFAGQQAVVHKLSYNRYGQWETQIVLQQDTAWAIPYAAYTNTDVGAGSGLIQVSYEDLLDAIGPDKDVDINNIGTQIDLKTGDIVLPYDDAGYQNGYGSVIDVGADWGDSYPRITGGVIPGEFSFGKEGEATITYEEEGEIEDEVIEDDDDIISNDPDDYVVNGLEEIFPFCIPFDLYNFVEALDAPPEAPVINWRFYVPGIVDETIELDLSVFDSVAQILRTMELLLFCVGLAFVTRKIIRG